jgi:hypothetical protein
VRYRPFKLFTQIVILYKNKYLFIYKTLYMENEEEVFIDSLNVHLDQINDTINDTIQKDDFIHSIYLENKEIKELEEKVQQENKKMNEENQQNVKKQMSRNEQSSYENLIRIRKIKMSENEVLNEELNSKRESILNKMEALNELYKNIKPKIEIIESLLKDYILSKGKYIFQTSQIFDENRLHLFDDIPSLQKIKNQEYYDLIHFLQELDSLSNRENIMTIFPPVQRYPNKTYPALYAFYNYLLKKENENKVNESENKQNERYEGWYNVLSDSAKLNKKENKVNESENKQNERYEGWYNVLSDSAKLNKGGKSMKKRRKQKKRKQTKKKLYKSSKVKRSMK